MFNLDKECVFQSEPQIEPGANAIQGDEWKWANPIVEGDDIDEQIFGTRLRFERADDIIPSLPVKVEITGRKVWFDGAARKMRCRITTWDSNEEPVSFPGWVFFWKNHSQVR